MECEKCKVQMEKGILTADSRHWMKEGTGLGWFAQIMNPGLGGNTVWAYRCGTCKKIEFVSD